MKIRITKSARRFGYIIWNGKQNKDIKRMICDSDTVEISINRISLGKKRVDWTYHRIYLGKKITQGFALDQTYYRLAFSNGRIDVTTTKG